MPTLLSLKLGSNPVLAFKVLSRVPLEELKQQYPRLRKETKEFAPWRLGFSEDGVYESWAYRSVFHLLTHQQEQPAERFLLLGTQTFVLTKLLESSGYFSSSSSHSNSSGEVPPQPTTTSLEEEEDLVLVSCALFHHILSLACNVHSINDIKVFFFFFMHID